MDIKSIFSRHLPAVQELHESIRHDMERLDDMCFQAVFGKDLNEKTPDLKTATLFDTILAGPKIKVLRPGDYIIYKNLILDALKNDASELPSLKQFQVFDHTDLSALKASYMWLRSMYQTSYWDEIVGTPLLRPQYMELFSGKMETPSALLALKYHWIFAGYDKQMPFEGILANTQPVRDAMLCLFGTTFGNQRGSSIRSTMQQQRMSVELGIDAFMLNSVLWMIGRQLSAE